MCFLLFVYVVVIIQNINGLVKELTVNNLLQIVLNMDPYGQFNDKDMCHKNICQFVQAIFLERKYLLDTMG